MLKLEVNSDDNQIKNRDDEPYSGVMAVVDRA